jgi:hypothetical protein
VYNQIIGLIEAGMLRGLQGEKGEKGEKGDAGAIKFIPVVRTDKENPIDDLPTENIDESAIYLLPIGGEDEQNRFTEYAYIDGQWEVLGAISIQVDHSEYVKFTDYPTASKAGAIKYEGNQYGIYLTADGVIKTEPATEAEILEKGNVYKPITPKRLPYAVKVGITTNTETLTDEEKASACDWLGAIRSVPITRPDVDNVLVHSVKKGWHTAVADAGNGLALLANGNLIVSTATKAQIKSRSGKPLSSDFIDYAVTEVLTNYKGDEWTKEQKAIACQTIGVDTLPDHLTLTDEQKAKWRAWLGIEGV